MSSLKFVLIYYLVKLAASEYEPAYLKVCTKDFKQSVESTQCDKGVWLKTPIEPGCICVRGVWALTNGFCDEKATLLVGDGHCFHIPFVVRSAKLIGDPKDPFKPKVYVTPASMDAVYEVREGNYTPTLLSESTLIIGVNPRQVAQRKDFGLCIDLNPSDYGKPVHIYMNPQRMSKEWTLDRKREYNCPSTSTYQHHVAFGEIFTGNKIEAKRLVERHCKDECPDASLPLFLSKGRNLMKQQGGRSMGGGKVEPPAVRVVSKGGYASTLNGDTRVRKPPGPIKTMQERQQEREEMRANATEEVISYEKEVNEQTLRMMHAHISPLLLNIPGPQVVTREYRYFQHIRLVTEKACPEEYVPKNLLKGLMRMFRQLLWETQDTFQHIESGDDGQFNRTMSRLAECANKTWDPSLLFSSYNESWSSKDNMTEPKPERCPEPIIYAINGTQYNRTNYKTTEPLFIRNYTYFFPPHLKYNSSQVDFVIESAWKITMIGHYRCSKYFDDETAIDFSQFFHQVQSFFNHRIIKRWHYEHSIQATYEIVKMIFPSYDLKKFMFGLDTCLFGTQGFSHFDYSNIWIQRPKIPHTENDLSQRKYVLPGSESLLNTLDYSPDPTSPPKPGDKATNRTTNRTPSKTTNPVTQVIKPDPKSGGPGPSKFGRRKKRDVEGYHMWNNRARCLNDYMEPVLMQEFGYHLPSDCITPIDPYIAKFT